MVQLFGAGNQVDGIKQWDSYEVESQKYLQIGERAIIQFSQTLAAEKRRHSGAHHNGLKTAKKCFLLER